MNEQARAEQFDDIELTDADADAETVVGGHQSPGQIQQEINKLKSKGFIEKACTTQGTLMVNPTTRQQVTVRF